MAGVSAGRQPPGVSRRASAGVAAATFGVRVRTFPFRSRDGRTNFTSQARPTVLLGPCLSRRTTFTDEQARGCLVIDGVTATGGAATCGGPFVCFSQSRPTRPPWLSVASVRPSYGTDIIGSRRRLHEKLPAGNTTRGKGGEGPPHSQKATGESGEESPRSKGRPRRPKNRLNYRS